MVTTILIVVGVLAMLVTSALGWAVVLGAIYVTWCEYRRDEARDAKDMKDQTHGYE